MSSESRFVLLLLACIAALIGVMVAQQARHRARLRRAEPLVLRVPPQPNLRQVAIVTSWFVAVTLIGVAGLVAALRAGAPLAPTLALGIVAIAAVAIGLALRAERRFSVGQVTLVERSLRLVLNVEGEAREIEIDLRQPFAVERLWCPRAPGSGAIVVRIDQGERSLYVWYPPRLAELRAGEFGADQTVDELRGLYLGVDGAELIRRLCELERRPV